MVDFRFATARGAWTYATVPSAAVDETLLVGGVPFHDTLLKPDLTTARIDPLRSSLSLICDVYDPATKSAAPHDARAIARRAHDYLRSTGIADAAHFGPRVEFFLMNADALEDDARRTGYAPHADLASIALELAASGVDVDMYESAGKSGRAAMSLRDASLVEAADAVMAFKDVVKNVAERLGRRATFMPKPFYDEPGSGMHCRQSLWKDARPLFFDANGFAECSQTMLYYIGGLLAHAPSVMAFAAPSTNSYKRLLSCDEAPSVVAFSARNRSAAVGVPTPMPGNPKAKRLEFRAPDPSANPYLAYSAMVLAGIDGIRNKIDPVRAGFGPLEREMAILPAEEAAKLKTLPAALRASLAALASDHDYLIAGGVFPRSFVDAWIVSKTETELRPVESRPHPYEYHLYLDC